MFGLRSSAPMAGHIGKAPSRCLDDLPYVFSEHVRPFVAKEIAPQFFDLFGTALGPAWGAVSATASW